MIKNTNIQLPNKPNFKNFLVYTEFQGDFQKQTFILLKPTQYQNFQTFALAKTKLRYLLELKHSEAKKTFLQRKNDFKTVRKKHN